MENRVLYWGVVLRLLWYSRHLFGRFFVMRCSESETPPPPLEKTINLFFVLITEKVWKSLNWVCNICQHGWISRNRGLTGAHIVNKAIRGVKALKTIFWYVIALSSLTKNYFLICYSPQFTEFNGFYPSAKSRRGIAMSSSLRPSINFSVFSHYRSHFLMNHHNFWFVSC